MEVMLLLVCAIASCVGALVGVGGGIIIKPVLDFMEIMPVASISFCSGCTVLAMAVFSLISSSKNNESIEWKTTSPLVAGAVIGGILGKMLFEVFQYHIHNQNILGAAQNGILLMLTALVFIYLCNKHKVRPMHIQQNGLIAVIGLCLGIVSSFLGIGGGPFNVVILYYFFSMDANRASLNSIFIIFCSQVASLFVTYVTGTIPNFPSMALIVMIIGGILGAWIARMLKKRLKHSGIEYVFKGMVMVIILLCAYNMIQYIAV